MFRRRSEVARIYKIERQKPIWTEQSEYGSDKRAQCHRLEVKCHCPPHHRSEKNHPDINYRGYAKWGKTVESPPHRALVLICDEQCYECGYHAYRQNHCGSGMEKKWRHTYHYDVWARHHAAVYPYQRIAVVEFHHQVGAYDEACELSPQVMWEQPTCRPYRHCYHRHCGQQLPAPWYSSL